MKKLIYLVAAGCLALGACGNRTAEQTADSSHIQESVAAVQAAQAERAKAEADSIARADSLAKAEAAEKEANSKKAAAALTAYKAAADNFISNWEGMSGMPAWAAEDFERDQANVKKKYNAAKTLEGDMTPEQKAEFKRINAKMHF